MHSKVMAFRLVETRRQAALVETIYVKWSKVSFLSSHARTSNAAPEKNLRFLLIKILPRISVTGTSMSVGGVGVQW
jgi:hypothetical protein